jgi:hypothetical protein
VFADPSGRVDGVATRTINVSIAKTEKPAAGGSLWWAFPPLFEAFMNIHELCLRVRRPDQYDGER